MTLRTKVNVTLWFNSGTLVEHYLSNLDCPILTSLLRLHPPLLIPCTLFSLHPSRIILLLFVPPFPASFFGPFRVCKAASCESSPWGSCLSCAGGISGFRSAVVLKETRNVHICSPSPSEECLEAQTHEVCRDMNLIRCLM